MNNKYIYVRYHTVDHTGCGADNFDRDDVIQVPSNFSDDNLEKFIEDEYVDYGLKSMEAYRGVVFQKLTPDEVKEYEFNRFVNECDSFIRLIKNADRATRDRAERKLGYFLRAIPRHGDDDE